MNRAKIIIIFCLCGLFAAGISTGAYFLAKHSPSQPEEPVNYWTQSSQNIYVAAHRGWRSKYPENTMAAYKAALDIGVDQIEVDVRVTKDGELVLIHDDTVDRTTNGEGKVCEMTLAELKTLDAGDGEQIPTLRELMELVKDHPTITLDLELKEYPTGDWEQTAYAVCDKTIQMVEEYNFAERCVINSFSGKLNDYVYNKHKGKYKQHVFYPQRYMGKDSTDIAPYQYGYCVCVMDYPEGKVTKGELMDLKEQTGIRLWVGAAFKDEKTIDMAIDLGAELITCDNPDEVLAILRKKGLHK